MGKSDWELFNCSEDYEHEYVAEQYAVGDRPKVRALLKKRCADGTIHDSTHAQVYALIKRELGLSH